MLYHGSTGLVETRMFATGCGHGIGGGEQSAGDTVVTSRAETKTEFKVAQPFRRTLHEVLVAQTPGQSQRGEVTPTVVLSELRAAICTQCKGSQIFVGKRIVDTTEE